jgi:tetratricopeptide (TPR) repeat protein
MGLVNVIMLKTANTITDDTQTNYTFFDRIFIAGHTFAVYFAKFIFPYKMLPLYSYPPTIPPTFYITSLLFVASCVGVWWAYRKGWTTVVFAWLFFFVNFIFVSQIVGAGQGFLADRFTYIAYFGFFFLLIHTLTEGGIFEKNKTAVNIGLAAYLIMCCVMTWNQVKIWKNGETLWTHQINNGEPTVTAWRNRGTYLRDNKQFDRALSDLNKAISLKSDGSTYNSRGKMLMDMGKPEQAVNDYTMALKLKPDMWEALANRGAAYGSLNKLDSAMADLSAVLAQDSLHVNALLNRGTAYGAMGKNDLSIIDLTKVVALNPSEKNAYLNRYLAYRETGQLEKAIADCSSYINLNKNNSAVWTDRGAIKKQMGRCGEAIPDFNEAIRIAPANGIAYAERAGCHFQMGNVAQGKVDAQAAVQKGAGMMIDPNWLKN